MSRAGWILLFIVFAVCAYATLQKEHMATASGHTLGPSTNVGDTSYADILRADTGQDTRYGPPTAPEPGPRRARMSGSAYEEEPPVPPGVTRTRIPDGGEYAPPPENVMIAERPAECASGRFVPGKGCVSGDDATAAGVPPICPYGGTYVPDPEGLTEGMCKTRIYLPPEITEVPQEPPPQCPPRRPFVPGKGCVGSNGEVSQPTCFDGAPYFPDPMGLTIGLCGRVPEPKRATQDRAPPSERPPGAYTDEGTPAQVAPAALTGLQVGGPNDGGIGRSSGGSSNATWGGQGTKYPNLLGPDNKKSNLPDNNMTANLVLPTPCQVGVDGSTLYSPGCRAPTDLGYFTLPTIPKTDGDPSPFSGDYTVFMK
jgi:hypothetical protein